MDSVWWRFQLVGRTLHQTCLHNQLSRLNSSGSQAEVCVDSVVDTNCAKANKQILFSYGKQVIWNICRVILKIWHSGLQTLNFATSCLLFNTLLILIVSTGRWPTFPCGRVVFGCLQLFGNCFSRLGFYPPPPFWSLSQAENGALGYSWFPVNAGSQH